MGKEYLSSLDGATFRVNAEGQVVLSEPNNYPQEPQNKRIGRRTLLGGGLALVTSSLAGALVYETTFHQYDLPQAAVPEKRVDEPPPTPDITPTKQATIAVTEAILPQEFALDFPLFSQRGSSLLFTESSIKQFCQERLPGGISTLSLTYHIPGKDYEVYTVNSGQISIGLSGSMVEGNAWVEKTDQDDNQYVLEAFPLGSPSLVIETHNGNGSDRHELRIGVSSVSQYPDAHGADDLSSLSVKSAVPAGMGELDNLYAIVNHCNDYAAVTKRVFVTESEKQSNIHIMDGTRKNIIQVPAKFLGSDGIHRESVATLSVFRDALQYVLDPTSSRFPAIAEQMKELDQRLNEVLESSSNGSLFMFPQYLDKMMVSHQDYRTGLPAYGFDRNISVENRYTPSVKYDLTGKRELLDQTRTARSFLCEFMPLARFRTNELTRMFHSLSPYEKVQAAEVLNYALAISETLHEEANREQKTGYLIPQKEIADLIASV